MCYHILSLKCAHYHLTSYETKEAQRVQMTQAGSHSHAKVRQYPNPGHVTPKARFTFLTT